MSKSDTLKQVVKKVAPKATFGTDPTNPWSMKANINEDKYLDQFLSTRGINPRFVTKNIKVAHSKSNEYLNWRRTHAESVVHEETDKKDMVCFDIPLLIRVLEFTREEMSSDIELHNMVERLINMRETCPLTMTEYDSITQKLVKENHIAIAMGKMLDDEGSMVLNQLDEIERCMGMIRGYIGKDYEKQMPAWIQAKITLASDYISTVGNYLVSKNEKVNENDLHNDFLKMLKDKGTKHRVHGTPEQEKQRTADKLAANKAKSDAAPKTSNTDNQGGFGTHRGYGQGRYMGDSVELEGNQLDELSKDTLNNFIKKSKETYRDVPNERKGNRLRNVLKAASKSDAKNEEVGPEDHKSQHNPWKQKHFGPHTVVSNRKMSDQEKVDWEKHKKWKQDVDNALASDMKRIKKEEVEVNEVSSELLGRYKDKAKKSADDLTASGKHKQSTDRWMNVMKATGKQIDNTSKGIRKALNKEEMMKSARIIKSIYKNKGIKEEMYDHEKDDKGSQSYGKPPKVGKSKAEGEDKTQAAAILKGGTTLTGQGRDTIEIDPMMRTRPTTGSPETDRSKKSIG